MSHWKKKITAFSLAGKGSIVYKSGRQSPKIGYVGPELKFYNVILECYGYKWNTSDYWDCIEIDGEVYDLVFDRYEDDRPVAKGQATLSAGNHTIDHVACPSKPVYGSFHHWETLGNLTVADPYDTPTTLTVNGEGTLRLYIVVSI